MKALRTFIIFMCLGIVTSCVNHAEWSEVEQVTDLGDGYDAAIIAKPSIATFESIGHFKYLRYKEKEIYDLGYYALSPDKCFIAFQESSTGKIFLLNKKEHSQTELVSKFPGLAYEFDWKTQEGRLKIKIYEKDVLIVPLPVSKSKDCSLQTNTAQTNAHSAIIGAMTIDTPPDLIPEAEHYKDFLGMESNTWRSKDKCLLNDNRSLRILYFEGFPKTPGGVMVVANKESIEVAGIKTDLIETEAFQGHTVKALVVYINIGNSHYRIDSENMTRDEFKRILKTANFKSQGEPTKRP